MYRTRAAPGLGSRARSVFRLAPSSGIAIIPGVIDATAGSSPITATRPSRSAAIRPKAASNGSSASRVRIGRSMT
jgi:hypothetical protein